MSLLAPTLQAYFADRLITQKDASPRTVAAYRDTFRLLLSFAQPPDSLLAFLEGLTIMPTSRHHQLASMQGKRASRHAHSA